MIGSPALADNLATRITAIILGSFVAVALVIGALMLWPRSGDVQAGLFQLPVPQETAAIVEALEAAPPAIRPTVVRALNTSFVSVHIRPDFPPVPVGLVRAPSLETLFKDYSDVLGKRSFRVDLRKGLLPTFLAIRGAGGPVISVQMSIRLRDGSVLVIERRPPALARSYVARAAIAAAVAGMVLLGSLALAIRQTARPVNRLALAVRDFSLDGETPDLPTTGPRELRALSVSFNEMQRRIRALVEDRTRVLGAIAHDLRTYLTRLRLRSEFIVDEDQRLRAARDIGEMAQLLDDVLLFAEQSTRPTDVNRQIDLARETGDLAAVRIEMGDDVELQLDDTARGVWVGCPALAYRRILSNLVDNALRYGKRARLSIFSDIDFAHVIVDDDGPGVPNEAIERIMRPFERLEESRARSTGGAGLGLAIVKGLAESVGADFCLANRPEGGLRASLRFRR